MEDVASLVAAAWQQHQAGQLGEAEALYRQALSISPHSVDSLHLLGLVLHQTGRFAEAIVSLGQAVQLRDDNATLHNHLGAAQGAAGDLPAAEASFRRALALSPDDAQTHYNLGTLFGQQQRTSEAIVEYQAALRRNPDFAEAYFNLGNIFRDLNRLDEAVHCFDRATQVRPSYARALNNLGTVLNRQGKLDQAEAAYRRALSIQPTYIQARNNLAVSLTEAQRLDEAAELLLSILAGHPDNAEAHNNLGVARMHQGRLDEALAAVEQALAINPNYAEAHKNRAVVWLFQGDFERGWPEYEWRRKSKDFQVPTRGLPLWDGAPLAGRTIVLLGEQGLGDTLQFVRFAPLVKQRGGHVVVECSPPLMKLLDRCPGVDSLVTPHDPLPASPLPDGKVEASLMSLPGIFCCSQASLPKAVPYLQLDAARTAAWGQRLAAYDGLKIGIAWQGNTDYRGDRFRSIPLSAFAALAAVPGVRLCNLQKGFGTEQLADAPFGVLSLGDSLDADGPFLDTAAAMMHLDLIVTCDTSIGHLAGALGRPVWLALAHASEWRWMQGRADTPWYPTMRLFRQCTPGDWAGVFAQMAEELRTTTGRRRVPG